MYFCLLNSLWLYFVLGWRQFSSPFISNTKYYWSVHFSIFSKHLKAEDRCYHMPFKRVTFMVSLLHFHCSYECMVILRNGLKIGDWQFAILIIKLFNTPYNLLRCMRYSYPHTHTHTYIADNYIVVPHESITKERFPITSLDRSNRKSFNHLFWIFPFQSFQTLLDGM